MPVATSNAPPPSSIPEATMVMRIITLALVVGPLVFTGIAVSKALQPAAPGDPQIPYLGLVAVMFIAPLAAAAVLVPRVLAARIPKALADRGPAPESWEAADVSARQAILGNWQTNRIVSMAIWEGLAMTGAGFLMASRDFVSLVPIVLGVAGVVSQFPTTAGVQAFADRTIEAWRIARDLRTPDR